jgi:O-antigen/teichoic acid export membrane protein
MPIAIFSNSFNLAFKSWSYAKMANGEQDKVVVGSYYAMVMLVVATLFYMVLLYYMYPYLVGDGYMGGRYLSIILIFSAMFSGFYQIVVKGILYSEKTASLTMITVPLGILYCVVIYNIAGIYGADGVAIANLIYTFTIFVIVWYVSNRIYPQPWLDIKALRGRG